MIMLTCKICKNIFLNSKAPNLCDNCLVGSYVDEEMKGKVASVLAENAREREELGLHPQGGQ